MLKCPNKLSTQSGGCYFSGTITGAKLDKCGVWHLALSKKYKHTFNLAEHYSGKLYGLCYTTVISSPYCFFVWENIFLSSAEVPWRDYDYSPTKCFSFATKTAAF